MTAVPATEGVKYIGSKRKLLGDILLLARDLKNVHNVLDLFSGTTQVAQAFKQTGYYVGTNDVARYSYLFSKTYIEGKGIYKGIETDLARLNILKGKAGFITDHYAGGAESNGAVNDIMYWRKFNALKADAIRAEIDRMYRPWSRHWCCLMTSLILALDRVDNTVGVQQAFLKNSWSSRSGNPLTLVAPMETKGPRGKAYNQDANQLVKTLGDEYDLVYLDPPYTGHNYISYYHIWETIVRNDTPEVSGITNRRVGYARSGYNTKRASKFLASLIRRIKSKYVMISYNNEGLISESDMQAMCKRAGTLTIDTVVHKRNVMSQIGIFDKAGKLVGVPGAKVNKEFLYLVER